MKTRDRFLKRYISRCKITSALAFFQWRCRTATDDDMYEKNKEIFYSRIENLVTCLEKGLANKKNVSESEKDAEKKQKRKIALAASHNSDVYKSMPTSKIVVMPEQKKDNSVFTGVAIDKKNFITSFEMIGWTDPLGQAGASKVPLKWLKSLTIENYIYPESSFDPKRPPPCIFVPEPALFNKMIEAVAKNSDLTQLLSKFADFKPPKPEWLRLEQEKKSSMMATVDREMLDDVREEDEHEN